MSLIFNPQFTVGQPISLTDYPNQIVVPGHVTAVAGPGGVPVAKFAIPDGDFPYAETYASRADYITNPFYTDGLTAYTSIPVQIPTGLPPFYGNPNSFLQFAEAKDTAANLPGWNLGILTDKTGVNCWFFGGGPGMNLWQGPQVDGQWHTFIVGCRYSTKPDGWVTLWMDGVQQTYNMYQYTGLQQAGGYATITDNVPAWPLDINNYRSVGTATGTVTVYHGAPVVGTTLADVLKTSIVGNGWSYAPLSIFGAWLISEMSPWVLAQPSAALAWYLDAIGAMFDPIVSLTFDQGSDGQAGYVPGYGSLLDPNAALDQDLPYLGQFLGVQIPQGTPDASSRALIKAESGIRRGSAASVITAAQATLTGTQTCTIVERMYADGITPTAGWFLLFARPEECPSVAALTAAVEANRPAGVFWTLTLIDGFTWLSATHTWAQDTMTWARTTYQQP